MSVNQKAILSALIFSLWGGVCFAAPPTAEIKKYDNQVKAAEEAAAVAAYEKIQAKTSIVWEKDIDPVIAGRSFYGLPSETLVTESKDIFIAGRLMKDQNYSMYLSKLDSQGNSTWSRSFGIGSYSGRRNSMNAIAHMGNHIFVGGNFRDRSNPGRAFVAAYDEVGGKKWVHLWPEPRSFKSKNEVWGFLPESNDGEFYAILTHPHRYDGYSSSNFTKFTYEVKKSKKETTGKFKGKLRSKDGVYIGSRSLKVVKTSDDDFYIVTDEEGTARNKQSGRIVVRKSTDLEDTIWEVPLSQVDFDPIVFDTALASDGGLLVSYAFRSDSRGTRYIAKVRPDGAIHFNEPFPYKGWLFPTDTGAMVVGERETTFIDLEGKKQWSKSIASSGRTITSISRFDQNTLIAIGFYQKEENQYSGFASKIRLNF